MPPSPPALRADALDQAGGMGIDPPFGRRPAAAACAISAAAIASSGGA